MSLGLRRRLAILTCRILQCALPSHLQSWGWAVRHEVAEVDGDTQALLFALNSLSGLAPRAIAFHLLQPLAILAGDNALSAGDTLMGFHDAARRPRAIGIGCAVGAAVLGIIYMALAGAPMSYLGVNAGALVVGLVLLAAIGRVGPETRHWPGAMTMMLAVALLATALLGNSLDGVARWIRLGPLFVQPSLVLLPAMIVTFARSRNWLSTAGMAVSAIALAIQPDRAMSGMLTAGLAVLAVMRPDRMVLSVFVGSVMGFAVTLVRADTLPAMPYVDQILYSSFDIHAVAGFAVLGGSVLLIVPAIVGALHDMNDRQAYLVFGIVWLAAIAAAALGNYPTPVVGYSGGAVLGYVLSLAMLPKVARSFSGPEVVSRNEISARPSDQDLCVALACSA